MIIGSGIAEHVLAWKLLASEKYRADIEIIACPGNKVLSKFSECLDLDIKDIDRLLEIAIARKITLTIVNDSNLLQQGIVDKFRAAEQAIVGPSSRATFITQSHCFAKNFMISNDIPCPRFAIFDNLEIALAYLNSAKFPLRIREDDSQKISHIAENPEQGSEILSKLFKQKFLSMTKNKILLEEIIESPIFTINVFSDGKQALLLPPMQNYKSKDLNNDNGAYAPTPLLNDKTIAKIKKDIIQKVLDCLRKEDRAYTGILAFDLVLENNDFKLMELRSGFGNSDAQVCLPLLDEDFYELMLASAKDNLSHYKDGLHKFAGFALAINITNTQPSKPNLIQDLEAEIEKQNNSFDGIALLYYGNKYHPEDPKLITTEIFGASAVAQTLVEAQILAYKTVSAIDLPTKIYEKNIGDQGLVV